MFTSTKRHWAVALGLAAFVAVTGASAAGYVTHTRHATPAQAAPAAMPVVSGDLGEVIVYPPHDLGEVIVHAPQDLGEVLVEARRPVAAGAFLAEVVVTAPREDRTATLVAAR
jgi:hypothetical protein